MKKSLIICCGVLIALLANNGWSRGAEPQQPKRSCESLFQQNQETRESVTAALIGTPYYFQHATLVDESRDSVKLIEPSKDRVRSPYKAGFTQFIFGLRQPCDDCSHSKNNRSFLENQFVKISIVDDLKARHGTSVLQEIESHLDRAALAEVIEFFDLQGIKVALELVDSKEIPIVYYQNVIPISQRVRIFYREYITPEGVSFAQTKVTSTGSRFDYCPINYSPTMIWEIMADLN